MVARSFEALRRSDGEFRRAQERQVCEARSPAKVLPRAARFLRRARAPAALRRRLRLRPRASRASSRFAHTYEDNRARSSRRAPDTSRGFDPSKLLELEAQEYCR